MLKGRSGSYAHTCITHYISFASNFIQFCKNSPKPIGLQLCWSIWDKVQSVLQAVNNVCVILKVLDYRNWDESWPHHGGPDNHCGIMINQPNRKGKWQNTNCTRNLPAMCRTNGSKKSNQDIKTLFFKGFIYKLRWMANRPHVKSNVVMYMYA